MGFFFDGFPIFFFISFLLVFGMVLAVFITALVRWNKNNHAPRLTVPATVVAKRMDVSSHHMASGESLHTTSTQYYVTFQVESGDRLELSVDGWAYGMLIEGDQGRLTFQGTRYLGFERN